MAGTAQHLAIADRVACLLGEEKIKNLPLFFSGNIAPDAIHARANYERSFKKHTHLTEGLHNGDFVYPDILAIFKKRLDDYIKTYYKKESEEAELYLGYISHLITDELFNIHSREMIVERMAKDGVDQNDTEFYRRFMRDMDSIDISVAVNYPFVHDIENELSSVWGYEIKDMILPEEADASKRWAVNKLFHSDNTAVGETKYYNYNDAYDFIIKASEEVAKRINELC